MNNSLRSQTYFGHAPRDKFIELKFINKEIIKPMGAPFITIIDNEDWARLLLAETGGCVTYARGGSCSKGFAVDDKGKVSIEENGYFLIGQDYLTTIENITEAELIFDGRYYDLYAN